MEGQGQNNVITDESCCCTHTAQFLPLWGLRNGVGVSWAWLGTP